MVSAESTSGLLASTCSQTTTVCLRSLSIFSKIDVAEWPRCGTHRITQPDILTSIPKIYDSIQSRIGRGRLIHPGICSNNGVLASLRTDCLPECPHTVNLPMMKPEYWITWGSEKISTWVSI